MYIFFLGSVGVFLLVYTDSRKGLNGKFGCVILPRVYLRPLITELGDRISQGNIEYCWAARRLQVVHIHLRLFSSNQEVGYDHVFTSRMEYIYSNLA